MNLLAIFRNAALKNDAGITFIHTGGREEYVSYQDLYKKAVLVLGALEQKGLRPGDEVVIQVADNKDLLLVFWACILGKIIPVPLATGSGPVQKLKIVKVWSCLSNAFWISDEQEIESVRAACHATSAEKEFDPIKERSILIADILNSDREGTVIESAGEDIAYIQFSSGSTGNPKGICLTHDNLLCNVSAIIKSLAITDTDVLLSWMPLTHDMGLIGFHLVGISRNVRAVSIDTALFIRRPLLWMDKTSLHKATVLYAPNFGYQYFLNALEKDRSYSWDLRCIRIIVNGAEPISASLCNRFTNELKTYGFHEHTITTAYGLAEASVAVTVMPVGTPVACYYLDRKQLNWGNIIRLADRESEGVAGFVDVGYPVKDCAIRICGSDDEVLPDNTVGQIHIKGDNVTKGYYNNPLATKEVFAAGGWLKTGDLGFIRNGRLVVTGRIKNIIIINGQNYHPHDIEQVIVEAGLAESGKVAACGIKVHQHQKEELVVFVLYKGSVNGFVAVVKAVRDCVVQNLGIPAEKVIPVKKVPKTTSGKTQHYLLVEQYLNGAFDHDLKCIDQLLSDEPATVTGLEHDVDWLLQIARDAWGKNDLTADTDLFEIGINSLMATQFINKVCQATGKNISVEAIFLNKTLTEFGRYLATANTMGSLPPFNLTEKSVVAEPSIQQYRIWTECQIHNGSAAYNIPIAYSIKGDPDISAVQQAFRYLIDRYEILRTSFYFDKNKLTQRIHDYEDNLLAFRYIDLTSDPTPEVKALDVCRDTINAPFQLDNPSQLRVTLIRVSPLDYVFVFVIHHILADGWSLSILLREFCETYNSLKNGSALPFISSQSFGSYTVWQRELLACGIFEKDKKYWLTELNNLPDPVGLSIQENFIRRSGHVRVDHHVCSFEKETSIFIKECARKYETTPFVIIMAVLNTILYRYTNQKDLVTGFDVSGRLSKELEQLVGYTLNTLCLRVGIDGECSFEEVVYAVKEKVALALQHQLLPFEKIMEENAAQGHAPGNWFFKILVLYQDFFEKHTALHIEGCDARMQPLYVQDGFVDLLLEFKEFNQLLELTVHYNTTLYSQTEIEQFTIHFKKLLKEASVNTAVKISQYVFLTDHERGILLKQSENRPEIMRISMPVHIIFQWRAAIYPDHIAVYSNKCAVTYKELNERCNVLAHTLKDIWAITPDDRVGFMVSRDERMIIAMIAILKSGAAYVPIDHETPLQRCEQIIKDSGMKCLLTDRACYELLSGRVGEDMLLDMDGDYFNTDCITNPEFTGNMSNLAYVVYTSGSTGIPKGVMVEHRSLCHYVQQFIRIFDITHTDIFIQQSSVAFDTLVEEVFTALCTSGTIVIAPNGGRDIAGLLTLIDTYKASVLTTTPLVLKELNKYSWSKMASLKVIISGGDLLHPSCIDQLFYQVPVYNTYGPTETTVCAAYKKVTVLNEAASIGEPIYGYDILILDENRQLMPYGKAGEICIEGGLARGYLNLPELTKDRFIVHPFDPKKKLYRSGDYGYRKNNGHIELIGRMDMQLKIRGYRIELAEIEKVMEDYEEVNIAAVLPDIKNEYLIAFVTIKKNFSVRALLTLLNEKLPVYMVPSLLEVIEEMPVTVTGKIDRQALKEKAKYLKSERPHKDPVNETEQKLLAIMKDVLQLEVLSTDSNIFECGCNSIKAHQIANKIFQTEGIDIRISELFSYPTIKELGELLNKKISSETAAYIIELE